MNNNILEKSVSVEEHRVDVFSKLLESRILFIDDLNYDKAATDVVAALLLLDRIENSKITMVINSEGGDIRNVFAIYDAMKLTTSPIETICLGSAMHESVLLLAAGTPGLRMISKNADICLAQLSSRYVGFGDMTNTEIVHNKIIKDNAAFIKALSLNIGQTVAQIKKDTDRQLFMTAAKAVKYGIVDGVI